MKPSDEEIIRQIKQMLAGGNKIAAVKQYREWTGAGLAEAKDFVEAVERGEPVSIAAQTNAPANSPDLDVRLKQTLLTSGKIAAVKLYRQHNPQADLHDAKVYVDRLESTLSATERNQMPKQGCASIIIFVILFAAGMTAAAALLR